MRWTVDGADCTDQRRVAGEDSEQNMRIHDKVQRCGRMLRGAEQVKYQMDDRHYAISC